MVRPAGVVSSVATGRVSRVSPAFDRAGPIMAATRPIARDSNTQSPSAGAAVAGRNESPEHAVVAGGATKPAAGAPSIGARPSRQPAEAMLAAQSMSPRTRVITTQRYGPAITALHRGAVTAR
jgi:hypothetical protein